eukprot:8379510-Lingulodinium_polyedra.AAC.1
MPPRYLFKYVKAVRFTLRHVSRKGRVAIRTQCISIGQHLWDAIVKQVGHDPIELPPLPQVIVCKDK